MTPFITQKPSPNFNARKTPHITMLVMHYTGMKSEDEALQRMCSPAGEVSAHYMINESGDIFQLVDETQRAWHAGRSYWHGETDINSCSIGIELVNPGHEHGYRPFPERQMHSLSQLSHGILTRHPIPQYNVVGHSDIAPERKEDPGELFDWRRLAKEGIGWMPKEPPHHQANAPLQYDRNTLTKRLQAAGYHLSRPHNENELNKVITAFQRHYTPEHLKPYWHAIADEALSQLLEFIR